MDRYVTAYSRFPSTASRGLERLTERLGRQADLTAQLLRVLPEGVAGVGEASVASTRLHLLVADQPGLVQVLIDADAGRVFYGRRELNQILHIDVFHAEGDVDHRAVARHLLRAAQVFARDAGSYRLAGIAAEDLGHYVDIQTGTGGGRATGSLVYGRRWSLRLAHRNHVHLAIGLPRGLWGFAVYAVAAAEEAVLSAGLELRRVERVQLVRGTGGQPLDLRDYETASDSWLRETLPGEPAPPWMASQDLPPADGAACQGRSHREQRPVVSGSSPWGGRTATPIALQPDGKYPANRWKGAGTQAPIAGNGQGSGRGAQGDRAGAPTPLAADRELSEVEQQGILARSLPFLREAGYDLGMAFFERLASGASLRDLQLPGVGSDDLRRWLRDLRSRGLLVVQSRDGERYRLTEAGRRCLELLQHHQGTLRRALRRVLHPPRSPRDWHPGFGAPIRYDDERGRGAGRHGVRPWQPGGWGRSLAVVETVTAALARRGLPLKVTARDLHQHQRVRRPAVDVCILLDASASMAGSRLRAAKELAHQMVMSTRDRVAVITFQERSVHVQVPLTRNTRYLERGLSQIQPYGLTPLAQGLAAALDFIRQSRARNPLLVLITDGIPTVPYRTANPLHDAVEVARQLAAGPYSRVRFTCIGLQPNERYLRELVQAAGGRLYVVDELERDTLVAIVHRERFQQKQRMR